MAWQPLLGPSKSRSDSSEASTSASCLESGVWTVRIWNEATTVLQAVAHFAVLPVEPLSSMDTGKATNARADGFSGQFSSPLTALSQFLEVRSVTREDSYEMFRPCVATDAVLPEYCVCDMSTQPKLNSARASVSRRPNFNNDAYSTWMAGALHFLSLKESHRTREMQWLSRWATAPTKGA